MQENQSEDIRYMTTKQVVADPSFPFSMASLRYYIFRADLNGLAPAIRRIGRKILFRRDLFIAWVENQAMEKE